MADRISIDTQLLEELSRQIRQVQQSLDSVNGKMTGSIAEVRRVASDQDVLIRKLQIIQQNTRKTAERTGSLARAVYDAANIWEETEKKIGQQKLPEGSETGTEEDQAQTSSGGGAGRSFDQIDRGDWMPGWLKGFLRNTPMGPLIWAGDGINLLIHALNGEEFVSGSINQYGWNFGDESGIKTPDGRIYTDTHSHLTIWDNDLVSLTWQDVEIFGQKVRMLVPYINIGMGVSADPARVGVGGETFGDGFHADVSAANGYGGYQFEMGFVDGKPVLHIGGGAIASAVSSEIKEVNKYVTIGTSVDVDSAGVSGELDYRDGVISGSVALSYIGGIDMSVSFNAEEWVKDFEKTVNDFTHGDFTSAAERAKDLLFINTDSPRTVLDYISKIF